jgi:phosphoserine phosphatase
MPNPLVSAIQDYLNDHPVHPSDPPLMAVFDCDGTVIRGDIGEAMLYFQIEQMAFKRSPADIWDHHPQRTELETLFTRSAHHGAPHHAFADAILDWYFCQLDRGDVQSIADGCADIVRLCAGFTVQEIRDVAEQAFLHEVSSPRGIRRLGKRDLPVGVRFIPEIREVIGFLQGAGVDIWAVSGSCTWSVEPVFRRLGVGPDRVIGIDLHEEGAVLGSAPRRPVPINSGKVDALRTRCAQRPFLVASDSPLDLPFLQYSSGLRLLVNTRNRPSTAFFAETGASRDDSWIVLEHPSEEPWPMSQ